MKTTLLAIMSLFFMMFSMSALADKIIIKGTPVVVEQSDNFYVPVSTVETSDYYYFKMGDTTRVCYKEVNPALASIDAGVFAFKLGSDSVDLHCYNYNTEYFVVE